MSLVLSRGSMLGERGSCSHSTELDGAGAIPEQVLGALGEAQGILVEQLSTVWTTHSRTSLLIFYSP